MNDDILRRNNDNRPFRRQLDGARGSSVGHDSGLLQIVNHRVHFLALFPKSSILQLITIIIFNIIKEKRAYVQS
jgi:hypothetical protein